MRFKEIFVGEKDAFEEVPHPVDAKRVKYIIETIEHNFRGNNSISVLDIGCGFGVNSVELAKCGYEVVGVDVLANRIAIGQEKYKHFKNLTLIHADVQSIESHERYHVVTMIEVLEHLYSPELILQKIHNELLTDDGVLIVTVPNGLGPSEISRDIRHHLYPKAVAANFLKLLGIWGPINACLDKNPYPFPKEGLEHKQYRRFKSWVDLFTRNHFTVDNYTYTMGAMSFFQATLKSYYLSRRNCNSMNNGSKLKWVSGFGFCLKKSGH